MIRKYLKKLSRTPSSFENIGYIGKDMQGMGRGLIDTIKKTSVLNIYIQKHKQKMKLHIISNLGTS